MFILCPPDELLETVDLYERASDARCKLPRTLVRMSLAPTFVVLVSPCSQPRCLLSAD